MKDHVTTPELATLMNLHPFRVSSIFADAFVYRADLVNGCLSHKYWSLTKVAEQITQASGHKITRGQLRRLITREQACELLNTVGPYRSLRTWLYWQASGIGPRVFYAGTRVRYLRSDVLKWVRYLTSSKPLHQAPAMVPMPPIPIATGDGGVLSHYLVLRVPGDS